MTRERPLYIPAIQFFKGALRQSDSLIIGGTMKACVVHNTLNSVGGGERVCLTVIEALKEMGYEVTLITVEPTDWFRVEKILGHGKIIKPDREEPIIPFKVRSFGIYMRLLTFLKLSRKWDLIVNTHGDVLPISSDIIYMHYPTFALLRGVDVNLKYFKSLFWRVYFTPYEKIQEKLAGRLECKVLLTNSEYSADAIRRYVGRKPIILYPPVDIDDFSKASDNVNREDLVVLCGRFSPEKNYEFALNVAENLPDIEFKIIGASSGRISEAYCRKLRKFLDEKRLKNVNLLMNASRNLQIEIYSRSKIFLHTMKGEHFGIAVVEGMAAGLIPVVHKSGGPWYDITLRGKYGFGYLSIDEAVEVIEKGIKDYWRYRDLALKRASMFSKTKFKEKFKKIVKYVINH